MRYVGTALRIQQTFKEVKEFEWEEESLAATWAAIKELLEGRMVRYMDEHLEEMKLVGAADRRNGKYEQHIVTEAGAMVVVVQCCWAHKTRNILNYIRQVDQEEAIFRYCIA